MSEASPETISIPPAVRESAISSLGAFFEPLNHIDRRVLGDDHVNPGRYLENIRTLDAVADLRGKKVLEIGVGYGVSLAIMLKQFGADAVGVEPASAGFDASFRSAAAVLEANGLDPLRVIDATGENLPFADASFDVVYSNNVLEHTQRPAQVLREAVRCLKPGGILYVEVPNYLSYYEGHYMVPQPPILWRGMLALWVRWVFRRDPRFARTLRTEINPAWMRRTLRDIAREHPLEVCTLGEERFLERLAKPFVFQTESVRGVAQRLVRSAQRLNVANWMGHAIVALNGHYPIVLVARRH
ncbi:MAG TPA: class I SAM-dependent methyltransferase [Steroidobacteraceae bacterium]|jgi:SAM-dependent methyltransferase|nr:class I SAM-dependent methyltransferase [Steroidobacteraceae bacterium]